MWDYNFFIYIVTNRDKNILYVGVTNDLSRRLYEHHENRGNPSTFAGKYHCYYFIHYERFVHIEEAICREKEIKKWRREKKWDLIKSLNPEIKFLNEEVNPQ